MTHNNADRPATLHSTARVAVTIAGSSAPDISLKTRAKNIAKQLGLPMMDELQAQTIGTDAADCDYLLVVGPPGDLALHSVSAAHGPVSIDFRQGTAAHRQRFGGGRKQPLARAIGLGKPDINTVIDATAGYGNDAYVMASLGMQVTCLEQSQVLALMLDEAILTARTDGSTAAAAKRIQVVQTEAESWLRDQVRPVADVIYLDPMYPQRDKTAKVKKGMQLLHNLIGTNDEGPTLLQAALQRAGRRVVVKRPASAAPLLADNLIDAQRIEIRSPNTRYDVYPIINPSQASDDN